MLKRKKQEESASKPRFLTKEERARLAIEKREKEIQAKKAQEKEKLDAIRKSHGTNNPSPPPSQNGRDSSSSPRNSSNGHHRNDSPDEDSEFASVRARYMGMTQPKAKKRRGNDRKVVFDWNPESDTSKPETEDASKPVSIGFGRGHLGGYTGNISKLRAALDRHWSEKELIEMTERDWRIFREDYNISTKGGSIPAPLRNWDEANFPAVLLNVIHEVGYKEPTPIQRQAIPIGLKCRDLIGIAETGSGKTAAFILPILVYIQSLPPITDFSRNDGPYAIVLAPTRELAQQIESEAHKFATPMGFRAVSIVGGHSIEEQAWKLTNGAEIVIATPGRLVDCLERHVLVLSQCNYVVMDEADRMIDLGFEDQVERVLDALPLSNVKPDTEEAENPNLMSRMLRLGKKELRYRNTVMFSATMPPALERIARKYMRRPATVIIGNAGQAVDTVEQRVVMVGQDEQKRKNKLLEILSGDQTGPIIVFVREKRMCDMVAKDLSKIGWKTVTLHGGKSQEAREAALNAVHEGRADCLVATDLAGRGIDVPNVKLVLNYHMAKSIEDYVHRIGRTGRAGKKGLAITFLGPEDTDLYYDLKQQLSKSSLSQVPEELKHHEAAQRRPEQAKSGNAENRFASLLGDRQLPPGFESLGAITQAATSRYTPSPLVLPRGYRHT